jgi:hypothetical protein
VKEQSLVWSEVWCSNGTVGLELTTFCVWRALYHRTTMTRKTSHKTWNSTHSGWMISLAGYGNNAIYITPTKHEILHILDGWWFLWPDIEIRLYTSHQQNMKFYTSWMDDFSGRIWKCIHHTNKTWNSTHPGQMISLAGYGN